MKTRIYTFDPSQHSMITGHTRHGSNFAGNFGTRSNPSGFELIMLDDFDEGLITEKNFKPRELKENVQIFRYETDRTRIGRIRPLVKINLTRGLAYFLTQKSSAWGEELEFESSGEQMEYIHIAEQFAPSQA